MPLKAPVRRATIAGIVLNALLFCLKAAAAAVSGSAALLADALNSLSDVLASVGIHLAVKVSGKAADKGHPFGHTRFQPIAAFVVAVLTVVLGLEVFTGGLEALLAPEPVTVTVFVWVALGVTIAVKLFMSIFFGRASKRHGSPALMATAVDSRNDVLITTGVVVAVVGSASGVAWLDGALGVAISIVIFKGAVDLFKDSGKYLVGQAPSEELIRRVEGAVRKVRGVKGTHELRAHYVGDVIHLEVHVEVDGHLSTQASHAIGKRVQGKVEALAGVDRAFVHIDPR